MVGQQDRRLSRLEERYAPSGHPDRWHRVIGRSQRELDIQIDELVTSGQARASDGFVCRLIASARVQ